MFFREMRRKNQTLSNNEIDDILYNSTSGVLALDGDNNYPYAVPISYVYDGEKIFFHCAKSGHKLDAIKRNPKASFCIIAADSIVPEKYTTYYQSVIVFGQIHVMKDDGEIRNAIEKLAVKYVPDDTIERRNDAINRDWAPLCMLEMTIDHITGKESKELAIAKQTNND